MKKKLLIVLSCLSVLSGILYFYVGVPHSSMTPPLDATWVRTTLVKQSTLPLEIHALGTISAPTVAITAEVPGHVAAIKFKDGAKVKRGDTLIQLDDAMELAKYQSNKAQLIYSKHNYQRMLLLGKQGAVAKQAIEQADADLKEKQAALKETQVSLNKLKLIAPFDGRVSQSRVNVGDYVNGAQTVVTLTDTQHLRVEYNVAESYLPLLKLDQPIKVTTQIYPNKAFTGNVRFISPTINIDNRSISLYAELEDAKGLLVSGMFVDVAQLLTKDNKVMMIPARSLVPVFEGEQVYKWVDGKAFPVMVRTGKRVNGDVEILEGLKVGDQVITDGQQKLRSGTPIKVKS